MTITNELVTIKIDEKEIKVLKGTNIIDAAKTAGIEIPHYCYHPHLSVAGNCRMCQVELGGRPKLEIACNTQASEGLSVKTHHTSKAVAEAQAATLEFILINHPLDCTVCDQAGHCKLQDYHFEYNARPSRFDENKEHKVKAEPLGPNVILDGERCIMCSRCVRFCDEITKTSEIGLVNRGDKTVIAVSPSRPLINALSGTVVDLCPVGALTHRNWRFNTRVWFTKQTDAICPGCSTGCNVKVGVRDKEVVNVKARLNSEVNKEWLCDEGRYGFMRFLPKSRITGVSKSHATTSFEEALTSMKVLSSPETAVFIGSDLTTEEYSLLKKLKDGPLKNAQFSLSYKERTLTEVESVLVSPDYAPNYQGALLTQIVSKDLNLDYQSMLNKVSEGAFKQVLVLGDRGILITDLSDQIRSALSKIFTVFIGCDASHPLYEVSKLQIGTRSILESSGILINRGLRAQYSDKVLQAPEDTKPIWAILLGLGKALGATMPSISTERELTLWYLNEEEKLKGQSIKTIKSGFVYA